MNQQQLDLLINLIDAKIAEARASDDEDGGLHEHIRVMEIKKELEDLLE